MLLLMDFNYRLTRHVSVDTPRHATDRLLLGHLSMLHDLYGFDLHGVLYYDLGMLMVFLP